MTSSTETIVAMRPGQSNNGFQFQSNWRPRPVQEVVDSGPQSRRSRLPVFQQVRMMLNSANGNTNGDTRTSSTSERPKWDPYTGELSASGQASRVQPSTYIPPFSPDAGVAPAPSTPPRVNVNTSQTTRSSPISLLRDDSVRAHSKNPVDWSPVSPVSQPGVDLSLVPKPLTPRPVLSPQTQTPTSASSNTLHQIKRKPAPGSASKLEETPSPPPPPQQVNSSPQIIEPIDEQSEYEPHTPPQQPGSRFSWTTYTPSNAYTPSNVGDRKSGEMFRQSIDTTASGRLKDLNVPKSRFSWSTINTSMTGTTGTNAAARQASSPPASPMPTIPDEYSPNPNSGSSGSPSSSPPVQSILSRRRPIQRADWEDRAPLKQTHDRKASLPLSKLSSTHDGNNNEDEAVSAPKFSKRSASLTPASALLATSRPPTKTSGDPQTGPSKALPPPPASTNLSHLESLQKREADLALQHRNITKAIAELERFEASSPLSVSWSTLQDVRDRLRKNQARRAEIVCEQREVGVAVSRARRKEGFEEGLWVRRVTG